MKQASICILLLLTVVLSGCHNGKSVAIQLANRFFASLSDTTNGKPKDFFPQYTNLGIEGKSDVVDIDESDVTVENDTFTVRCYNSYTDASGTFKQDSVTLFINKDKAGKRRIFDSQGLVETDKDTQYFGKATGAFPNKALNDLDLAKRIENVRAMIYNEYLNTQIELSEKVKLLNWSWKISYSGDAHGEGRVVNNLEYPIEGIKYHINYYDRSGKFMAQDDGSISKELYPGEKYSFTFWSSNAKYPETANLRLDFPDMVVLNILKSKEYKGDEYQKFIKKNEHK